MDLKKIDEIEASLLIALEKIQKLKEELGSNINQDPSRKNDQKLKRKSKYKVMLFSRKK